MARAVRRPLTANTPLEPTAGASGSLDSKRAVTRRGSAAIRWAAREGNDSRIRFGPGAKVEETSWRDTVNTNPQRKHALEDTALPRRSMEQDHE
jgi:hypothetical protein